MVAKRRLAVADRPVVLQSAEDVAIRSNARKVTVHVVQLREKMKDLNMANGSIVAMALDKAGITPSEGLDIRVNGQKANLLQVLRDHDSIYLAPKVGGGLQ